MANYFLSSQFNYPHPPFLLRLTFLNEKRPANFHMDLKITNH